MLNVINLQASFTVVLGFVTRRRWNSPVGSSKLRNANG
ncbi:uncharacterized protein METZ01_LOCUS54341 [marine metagenome]|uniref:Uncharacterized protein n=1 Tax=marine metagenome TaxID=408172 RepID=A0A381SGP7_9ZZZZ